MVRRRIFLVIMFLLTVLMIYDGFNLPSKIRYKINANNDGFTLNIDANESYKEGELVIDGKEIISLNLLNQAGDVQIIGEERDDIRISYKIVFKHLDEGNFNEYLDDYQILHQINNKGQLKVEAKKPSNNIPEVLGVKINYQIQVPKNIDLAVRADFGKMVLQNINGDIDGRFQYATSDSGAMDLSGNIRLEWDFSTAKITDIVGNLDLKSSYGQLTIFNVTDKMKLTSKFSELVLKKLGSDLDFETTYGNMDINNVAGNLIGKTSFTGITGSNIEGTIKIMSNYGTVNLGNVTNSTEITSSFAPVNLTLVQQEAGYQLDLDVKRGKVDSKIELVKDEIATNHTRYTATYQAGDIPINVKSDYGNISINVQ